MKFSFSYRSVQNDRQKWRVKVDADGDLDRYLQECMLVHDEWITL